MILDKDARISTEKKRLLKILENMPADRLQIAMGLIERAAFIRISCEDLEQDLKQNGWAEPFTQSEKLKPYDRSRPQGNAYNSLIVNYQKIIKQLIDLAPDMGVEDELMNFIDKGEDNA